MRSTSLVQKLLICLLTRVYFDIANECVFEFNGLGRRVFGTYQKDGDNITVNWHFPETMESKSFKGSVTRMTDGVELKGDMESDSILAILENNNDDLMEN